mmetsp:Transcript_16121/g.16249  ORF Transcript_16121/g.16249 Transcript_16121/m.16249 type:complete len:446 (-) Transcript_16121:37-1374(-)
MNLRQQKKPITGVPLYRHEQVRESLRKSENESKYYESKSEVKNFSVRSNQSKRVQSDAAALQSDIAKRYNLPGAYNGTIKKRSLSISSSAQIADKSCPCCNERNSRQATVCSSCGFFLSSNRVPTESLAQARGLVPAAEKIETLSQREWEGIENRLDSRGEAFCPICMDGFNRGHEVLLSCSHMFHRNCLQAFEKYVKAGDRMCPICRTPNYQKKITHKGTQAYAIVCSIKLQALWRGYKIRQSYRINLRNYYKEHKGELKQRKKFYEQEFTNYTEKMSQSVTDRSHEVDNELLSIDNTLRENRALDLEFEQMLLQRRMQSLQEELYEIESNTVSSDGYISVVEISSESKRKEDDNNKMTEIQWSEVLVRAQKRGLGECAICMSIVGGSRITTLLSCSHLFHEKCITSLERFCRSIGSEKEESTCPVCRSTYQRRAVSSDCMSFL